MPADKPAPRPGFRLFHGSRDRVYPAASFRNREHGGRLDREIAPGLLGEVESAEPGIAVVERQVRLGQECIRGAVAGLVPDARDRMMDRMRTASLAVATTVLLLCHPSASVRPPDDGSVVLVRVPGHGIQPEIVVDGRGVMHV